MTHYPRLQLLALFLLVTGSFNSHAIGQQITSEGVVIFDGQQTQPDSNPIAFVNNIGIGGQFFDSFASGKLTLSDGAFLDTSFISIGSGDQPTAGILEARGIGTSVISQNVNLFAGSFSVSEGATANVSTLDAFGNAPINISGVGSQLTLGSAFLAGGPLNISDSGFFSAGSLSLGARMNLTDGGQAVIQNLNLDSGPLERSEISIGENSSLLVHGNSIGLSGNSTITLEGGWLIGIDQILNITGSGELRGYGEVIGEIQLDGSEQGDHRLTVTADQTLRTSGIRNFTGHITNFGTLDAGTSTIENGFDGRYLGENSTIRADLLVNNGKINLTNGRNFVEANLDNRDDFNISGGASVIFTREVFNTGVVHTADGSTSTFLGSLFSSGVFEGEGDVTILGEFTPGDRPRLVSFKGDLAFGAGTTTEIELGGTLRSIASQQSSNDRYDAVDVGGTLTLGGELEIVLVDGFDIESGQEFVIADVANELIGQFNGLAEGDLVGNFGGTDLFISYVAGDGNDVALFSTAVPNFILGDANQDGVVDFSDIPAFITILQSGGFLDQADVNEDGVVNFSDIPAFIEILLAN